MKDIKKLPKWAQRKFSKLEADVKYYKEQLRQVNESDTNVFISDGMDLSPLPRDSRIRFIPDKDENHVNVRHKDDMIYIYASAAIKIIPQSVNTVLLGIEK